MIDKKDEFDTIDVFCVKIISERIYCKNKKEDKNFNFDLCLIEIDDCSNVSIQFKIMKILDSKKISYIVISLEANLKVF